MIQFLQPNFSMKSRVFPDSNFVYFVVKTLLYYSINFMLISRFDALSA